MRNKLLFTALVNLLIYQTTLGQSIQGSIMHDGTERNYWLYVPEIYNGEEAVPLVLNLHGLGSNSLEQQLYGDFRDIADTANFIIVHPDGLDNGDGSQFWNVLNLETPDDVGFLSALIDTIQASYNIDSDCIYSTGMSNGGFMSYELACQLSPRIAAIASVTGSMSVIQSITCNCDHPMPVMEIHGTEDAIVPYEGTFGIEPIDDVIAYWTDYNQCGLTPEVIAFEDIDPNDNATADRFVYSGGDNGTTVELIKVYGGDHSWPGALININTTCMDFSASAEIWKFFRKYKLSQLVSVAENAKPNEISVFGPN
ncbi:MAG: hypothetical protein RL220_803, partial [Bacteroidota bacterium]